MRSRSFRSSLFACALLLPVLCAGPRPAAADNAASAERLRTFLTTPDMSADLFSQRMLDKIPLADLVGSRQSLFDTFGKLCAISPLRVHLLQHLDRGTIEFERGAVDVKVVLDGHGRIDELLFLNPIAMNGDITPAVRGILDLPGTVSLAVIDNGHLAEGARETEKTPIPNIESLSLLERVTRAVDAGRLDWNSAVPWRRAWSIEGSRILANWPDGHALTIRALTDFAVQNETSAVRALETILDEARLGDTVGDTAQSPVELCRRVEAMDKDGSLSVWHGPAVDLGWDRVSYKGGGNATTINHTMLLQSGQRRVCLSATWKQPEGASALLFQAHVRTLAGALLKQTSGCIAPNS